MSTLRIRGIPQNITKDRLSELYPDSAISLSRTESSAIKTSQTATVTFHNEETVKDIIRNRPLKIDGQAVIADDKFDGLTVLHLGLEPIVDIVAVHGMGGHAFRSWASWENKAMWLRDFLPTDIPEARIMTYGYNSDFMDSNSVAGIHDFASRLLTVIDDQRTEEEKERPIIFICHSLGGIVVKQALNIAREQPQLRSISGVKTGIVFLATPHNGSRSANYGYIICLIATIQGLNQRLIQDLQGNSGTLTDIAKEFSEYCSSIMLASFYETRKSNFGFLLGTKLAVDKASSTLNVPHETRDGLDKDHMQISKFENSEDGGYRSVVKRIQGMIAPVVRSVQRPLPPKIGHFLVPYSRNSKFSSRGDILERLLSETVWTSHQRIALYGLGGIGKTQIAIEYAYQCQCLERPPGVKPLSVFWVHGSSYERFLQDYRGISKAANLPEAGSTEDDILLNSTKNWLQSPESGDWVLILDNADDLQQYYLTNTADSHEETPEERKLSDFIPQGSKGIVLVTTRDRQVAERVTEDKALRICVPKMNQEEATSLFIARGGKTNSPEDQRVLGELLLELEYLPLAITQAAAYISSSGDGMTVPQYFEMFSKCRTELLREEFTDSRRDPTSKNPVLKTWLISFKQIQIQSPLAANILRLIAFLDRQAIPKEILKSSRLEGVDNDKVFIDALRKLMAFSLITPSSKGTYEVHRLVHIVTYESLSSNEKQEWQAKALNLVARVFPSDYVGSLKICEAYRAHASTVIKHWPRSLGFFNNGSPGNEADGIHTLFTNLGMFLRYIGQLVSAEDYLRRSLEISLKVWGPSHRNTLISLGNLSSILQYQGKLAEAEEMCRRALDGHLRVLGPDHPHTLTSLGNLSSILKGQGKLAEAEEMCRRALGRYMGVLGPDHPDTLTSLGTLSSILQGQGKLAEAEGMCRRVLDGRLRALGPDHPDTLKSLGTLSSILQGQGKLTEAEGMCRRALDGRLRVLGPDHPDTLTSLGNLSFILQGQGKLAEAEEMRRRALDGHLRVLGPDHPHTLTSISNLSSILQDQGKLAEAEEICWRALDGRLRVLGPDHPDTLISISNLSSILQGQGKLAEAEEMCRRALDGRLRVLGPDHPHTLTSPGTLSSILQDQGKLAEAEEMCRRALDGHLRVLGPDHPHTLTSLSILSSILQDQGKLAEAEEMRRRVLDGHLRVLGPDHLHTLTSLGNLSSILKDQGRSTEASELGLCLKGRKKSFDPMVELQGESEGEKNRGVGGRIPSCDDRVGRETVDLET